MNAIPRLMEMVALGILLLGGLGLIISTFLGAADVVGTQFVGQPVAGALEITGSTMVLIVFGALAYSQIRRNQIRVELIYARANGRVQAAMDVFAGLMGILFFSLLLWQAINEALFSLQIDESTFGLIRIPLWPARIVPAAGTALMILQLLIDLAGDVRRSPSAAPPGSAEERLQKERAAAAALLDQKGR